MKAHLSSWHRGDQKWRPGSGGFLLSTKLKTYETNTKPIFNSFSQFPVSITLETWPEAQKPARLLNTSPCESIFCAGPAVFCSKMSMPDKQIQILAWETNLQGKNTKPWNRNTWTQSDLQMGMHYMLENLPNEAMKETWKNIFCLRPCLSDTACSLTTEWPFNYKSSRSCRLSGVSV